MRVKNIYTNNLLGAKDYLIRTAIKLGLQYIDIDNEVHIEGIIYRFYENKILGINNLIIENGVEESTDNKFKIDLNCREYKKEDFENIIKLVHNNPKIIVDRIPKFNKKDYLVESRKSKSIIKKRGIK